MITKQKKSEILRELDEIIKTAKETVFLNFHGESVAKTNFLRKELKKREAAYKVAKKTLIKKILANLGFKGESPNFEGETALVLNKGGDIIDVLKFIAKQTKNGKFKILGGIFENEYKNAEFMIELSKIPAKEIIYARFLYALNSPLSGLVGALNGGIINFIRVLNQISKQATNNK